MEYTNIPRPEYPRPQFVRKDWMNLNGPWEHQTDPGQSGSARGLQNDAPYDAVINVPFCRESRLSGIGDVDFCECVWYRRTVTLPEGWREDGRRTIELITAIYKSGSTGCGVELPLKKDDPFYTVEGIMASVPHFYEKTTSAADLEGDITLGSSYGAK